MAGETAETAAAVEAWDDEREEAVQLGLPVVAPRQVVEPDKPRGPGRPPGSKNRAREDWRRMILSRYRSPLEAMASVVSMPAGDLYKALKAEAVRVGAKVGDLTMLEAVKLQLQAARELAPYLHGKVTPDTGDPMSGLVNINLFMTADQAQRSGGAAFVLDLENQGVSDAEMAQSDNDQSDSDA